MNFSILLFLVVVGCLESATPSGNFDGVLSVFTKSIQAQNVEGAMKLLDDGFQFRTCAKTMTKDRIRSIFEEFVKKANPSKFELSPVGEEDISGNGIWKIPLAIKGLGQSQLHTVVYINMFRGKFLRAIVNSCKEVAPFGAGGENSARKPLSEEEMKKTAETFVEKMVKAFTSRSMNLLKDLYTSDYSHDTCGNFFERQKFIKAHSQADPRPHNYKMKVDLVQDVGSAIRFVASLDPDHGENRTQIDYYLNKKENKLENGCVLTCTENTRNPNYTKKFPGYDKVLSNFVEKLASRDFYLISDLFTPTFELRTCDYVFDRDVPPTMQYKWQLTGLGTKGADVVQDPENSIVQPSQCSLFRQDEEVFRYSSLLGCVWAFFCFCKNFLQKKLCGNPTPRNHNTPANEVEKGPVAHVAAAESPAPAGCTENKKASTENKKKEDSGYKFRNPDNWSYI
ncbi:Protein CBG10254 [Caenorhabditis briggsae]|uniref:Protein CBG10254 n=1 Tax=Caenorhabditis briggsae TaxID=6238 RepID=A8XAR9_CAEBR|nr:Protein CBG10254 [Caenorhabditis briggsae]CAP29734.2 Protein CBG10254 [Caenorhabditis briggsae]